MTKVLLILTIICTFQCCAAQNNTTDLDFEKINWTPIDEFISYHVHSSTDQELITGDTVFIELIGKFGKKEFIKTPNDTLKFELVYGTDTEIPQLNEILRDTKKNSEIFIKLQLKHFYSKIIEYGNPVTIILVDSLQKEEKKIITDLTNKTYVHALTFISKEQAMQQLEKELGSDFTEFLGFNPLKASIELTINPDYLNTIDLEKISEELQTDIRVKEVIYSNYFFEQIEKYKDKQLIFRLKT